MMKQIAKTLRTFALIAILASYHLITKAQTQPQLWVEGTSNEIELFNDGFESGIGNYTLSGAVGWTTSTLDSYSGNTSAFNSSSCNCSNTLTLDVSVPANKTAILTYWFKTTHNGSTLNNGLRILINGNTQQVANGISNWTEMTFFLPEGNNTISWENYSTTGVIRTSHIDDINISYNENSTLRINDGSEGFGKVLTSDTEGNATWMTLNEATKYANSDDLLIKAPLTLNGENSIGFPLTTTASTLAGLYSTGNQLDGIRSSQNDRNGYYGFINDKNGFYAKQNLEYGFSADSNALGGYFAYGNDGYGYSAEQNQGSGYFAVNNSYTGYASHSNSFNGYYAWDNPLGFLAVDNNGNGFFANSNDSIGFVAHLNDYAGFLADSSGFDGIISRNHNFSGFLAQENYQGYNSFNNSQWGFTATQNFVGYDSFDNATNGINSESNGSHGLLTRNNTANGVYSFSNYGNGYSAQGNIGNGILCLNNDGDAGYFSGDVTVTGNISKGGGSFKIDHPLDPENKYLYHSFVESPDMMNVYNGNVVLDEFGEATVVLEEWFETLNRDFRYQLTAIGGSGPNLYIAEEVNGNSFKIAGGSDGLKVSWQITGIRQDKYAEANRIETEVEKEEKFKGYYLHPDAYGVGERKGYDYVLNNYKTFEELKKETLEKSKKLRK